MDKAYTLDDLIKAAQVQAEEEKEEKPQGEKSDKELTEEEKKKKQEAPPEEEMKTSSLKNLAEGLRATAAWLDKTAGPVSFSEPTDGGGTQEGGRVTIEPVVTGTQPHPTPTPIPEHDATKVTPLGTGGAVQTTEVDPLTTQTQAEPGDSTAMETGKTTSGPTKKQPVAADQAKTSELAQSIRQLVLQKKAATPIDGPAEPAGDPPAGGGDVGYTEPTDSTGLLGGDAAATNLTPQQAEQATQKPDLAPLLKEQPETHAEGGTGTPNVDVKLGAWQERLLSLAGGE